MGKGPARDPWQARVGGGPRGWAPPDHSPLQGVRGLRPWRGRRIRAPCRVPPLHLANRGVGGDVTARLRPPPVPAPLPEAAATPVPLPVRQTSWRLGLRRRAQPTSAAGGARGGPGRGRAARHAVPPSQRPAQPWSSSSSALGDPRPCPCLCRAAPSDAGEVRRPPAWPLAPALRYPHLHQLRPAWGAQARSRVFIAARGAGAARAAPSLPPTLGEQWGKFKGVPLSFASRQGPRERPRRCGLFRGWTIAGRGGGRHGEGAHPRRPLETPPPSLPRSRPFLERGRRARPAAEWGGGQGRRGEHADGGAGERAGQLPESPGWGRADAGAQSITGRRAGRAGAAAEGQLHALLRDCPSPSPRRVLLPRDPSSLLERLGRGRRRRRPVSTQPAPE